MNRRSTIGGHISPQAPSPPISTSQQLFLLRRYEESLSALLDEVSEGASGPAMQRNGQSCLFYQGSRIIRFTVEGTDIHAAVAIAQIGEASVPLMRYLLELNFPYTYIRFVIDGDHLFLRFDADFQTYGPERILEGLRELGIEAEIQHHQLLQKFGGLRDTDEVLMQPASGEACALQNKYFKAWTAEALAATATLDPMRQREGISDILLTALLRIEHLLRPEGPLRFAIRGLLDVFFGEKESLSWEAMNQRLRKHLEDLAAWPPQALSDSWGRHLRAFPAGEKYEAEKLRKLLKYTDSYLPTYRKNGYGPLENKSWEYPLASLRYLYHLPEQLAAITDVFYRVNYPDYFKEAYHLTELSDPATGIPDAAAIIAAMETTCGGDDPFPTKRLQFGSLQEFNASLMHRLSRIRFTIHS